MMAVSQSVFRDKHGNVVIRTYLNLKNSNEYYEMRASPEEAITCATNILSVAQDAIHHRKTSR